MDDYLTTKRLAGHTARTVELHRHYLTRLAQWCPETPQTVNRQRLVEFLTAAQWAAQTRRSATSVVRTFFTWLADNDYRVDNPATRLPRVKLPATYARPAPDDVIREALTAVRKPKHRWMLLLAAECGLRCAEIAAIEAEWWDGATLHVIGKGGKRRPIPVLNPELRAALDGLAVAGHRYLFPGHPTYRPGEHVLPGSVTQILRDYLPGAWSAHKLRHRAATTVYQATGDILLTQQMLGHSKPETTARYVKLAPDALAAAMSTATL